MRGAYAGSLAHSSCPSCPLQLPTPKFCRDVSPTTQMPLPHKMLTPNSVLRASLLDLLRNHC